MPVADADRLAPNVTEVTLVNKRIMKLKMPHILGVFLALLRKG